jgi:hypothetical protein
MFQKRRQTQTPVDKLVNHLVGLWTSGELQILGKFNQSNNLLGIVVLSMSSNRLSFIHIFNTNDGLDQEKISKYERELFDAGFSRLKENEPWVTSGGSSWLSENLIDHALDVGFRKYENIGMSASREALKDLKIPPIPTGYSLEPYSDRLQSEVSQLFFDCLQGSTECNAEPDVWSTPQRCANLVHETVNNQWGDFKDGKYSWVLKYNGTIIGISLFTIMNNTTGFGVGICLNSEHRGKGLERLMFIQSLVKLLDSEPDVQVISHATSATNSALPLYKSIGFQEISRHSLYTWVKED